MEALSVALGMALSIEAVGAVALGAFVGLVFGSIPGLTFSVALALMLPVAFAMESGPAMALLLGTYIGGMTGGSVSAILVGIPGTPSAAATVIDGYAMTKQGRASVALGTAVIVSTFGGLFSLVIMMALVDVVSELAIQFGPAEIFMLVLFGLSTICGLAEKSMIRGLIAGVIGLMLMTVGLDQIEAVPRMTFGSVNMLQGVNLLVAMIGLFAVPQVMSSFLGHDRKAKPATVARDVRTKLPSWAELKSRFWLMIRCAGIGTGIGAIPGTGGPIAAFLAYDHARRFSKDKDRFGKGDLSGVVAPETANNAVTGGAMIPLLSLGIPGDPATAVILGGLLIHGLTPGPMLFLTNAEAIYAIYIAIILAYLFVLVFQLYGIRLFVRILQVPPHYLAIGIIVMCGIGSYAIRNSIFDVYVMAVTGVMGYVLSRLRIPVTPVVLGLVLGKTLENEYRTALIMSRGDFGVFVGSAPAVIFLGLTVLTIVLHAYSSLRKRNDPLAVEDSETSQPAR